MNLKRFTAVLVGALVVGIAAPAGAETVVSQSSSEESENTPSANPAKKPQPRKTHPKKKRKPHPKKRPQKGKAARAHGAAKAKPRAPGRISGAASAVSPKGVGQTAAAAAANQESPSQDSANEEPEAAEATGSATGSASENASEGDSAGAPAASAGGESGASASAAGRPQGSPLTDAEWSALSEGRRGAIAYAASKLGLTGDKRGSDGSKVGWQHIQEFYKTSFGDKYQPTWDRLIKTVGQRVGHWCGIFALSAVIKGGRSEARWQIGRGPSGLGKFKPGVTGLKAGDIVIIKDAPPPAAQLNHHALVEKVQGDTIYTIDGNSFDAGANQAVRRTTRKAATVSLYFDADGR